MPSLWRVRGITRHMQGTTHHSVVLLDEPNAIHHAYELRRGGAEEISVEEEPVTEEFFSRFLDGLAKARGSGFLSHAIPLPEKTDEDPA